MTADQIFNHTDLTEPPVPSLPMGTSRVEKPDAAAFVNLFGRCPCCGNKMAVLTRSQNNLLVTEARHT